MPSARAIWSGAISFGLVNIPVKLYTATETKDISFTTLHATCRSPLKRAYMCPVDNVPVESKEMVKGYPVGKAQYVTLPAAGGGKRHLLPRRPGDSALLLPFLSSGAEVKPPPETPATKPITITEDEM